MLYCHKEGQLTLMTGPASKDVESKIMDIEFPEIQDIMDVQVCQFNQETAQRDATKLMIIASNGLFFISL